MAKSFTLYKLIILYMLNEVDFPLTNSQISEFILDEGYTTYFKLQQALSELLESGFIREESTHHRTFYHLTEDGAETIHYFTNDISPAIQHDIDEFLKEKHYELKNEMSVKADYFENSNMEYSVNHGETLELLTMTSYAQKWLLSFYSVTFLYAIIII